MLQTTELGLGTVWVSYFRPDVIKKEIQLLEDIEPVNILVVDYGKEKNSSSRTPFGYLYSYRRNGFIWLFIEHEDVSKCLSFKWEFKSNGRNDADAESVAWISYESKQ